MPRQSKAEAALSLAYVGPARRPEPPLELGEPESVIFRQTVAAAPVDHFLPEDLPLLCAYVRCAVLERRAAEQLAAATTPANATIHSQVTKTLMALSVRLRIGPRSRDTNRRPAKSGARAVSFYETMTLPGDADAQN